MKTKTRYMVAVLSDNGRYTIRDCGHKHTTLSGAVRCMNTLAGRTPDGIAAEWWRAEIMHIDESPLTPTELRDIESIQYKAYCEQNA